MDYVSMKMSIYENYANGKLSRGNARQLIDVLNNNTVTPSYRRWWTLRMSS